MADKDSTQDTASDVYCVTSDYTARDPTQISLEAGDTVTVLEAVSDEWWWVEFIDKNDKPLVGYAPVNHLSKEIPLDEEDKWENSEYFSSYGQLKLHSEMLTDVPRTSTYSLAIQSALPWLQDKVVLDVGSGTGILSLFCARYGKPKKVYAVEASDIAVYSRETVLKNGYEDVIEVIQGNINDISLPHHQVDWIISEWMGTLLLFEFMIESVINARDKFLKPDGMIWPSEAELFLIPCSALSAYNGSMGIWKDVYGFDFSPYLSLAADTLTGKPIYNHTLSPDECLSEPFTILQLNMKTVTVSQLEDIRTAYDFLVKRSGMLHGFASYFTVHFSHLPHPHTPVTLSTSPQSKPTHWKQDLFLLDSPLQLEEGQRLKGTIKLTRHKLWRRHLRVTLTYSVWEDDTELNEAVTKIYRLWR